MARERNAKRITAFQMWKESEGKMSLTEIANTLGIAKPQLSRWKKEDKWEDMKVKKKTGRGAPKGNQNHITHGLYSRHIPAETLELMSYLESKDPVEVLRENINLQYAAIIRAQSIMFVASKDDITKELKSSKGFYDDDKKAVVNTEEQFNIQYAWDKQGSFLNAQSKAIGTLEKLITRYEQLCGPQFEQEKLKVKKLKQEIVLTKEQIKETKGSNNKQIIIKSNIPRSAAYGD